jgi:hypothetical protein
MRVHLEQNIYVQELGWLDVGIQDVPDGLAATLVYQGRARTVSVIEAAPDRVAALMPPQRRRKVRA